MVDVEASRRALSFMRVHFSLAGLEFFSLFVFYPSSCATSRLSRLSFFSFVLFEFLIRLWKKKKKEKISLFCCCCFSRVFSFTLSKLFGDRFSIKILKNKNKKLRTERRRRRLKRTMIGEDEGDDDGDDD